MCTETDLLLLMLFLCIEVSLSLEKSKIQPKNREHNYYTFGMPYLTNPEQ